MNSAARLIFRLCFATVLVIIAGTVSVFGFQILEPVYFGFGEPASSLNWGEPGKLALTYASFGMLGVFLVIILWFVYAPIKEDVRQEVR